MSIPTPKKTVAHRIVRILIRLKYRLCMPNTADLSLLAVYSRRYTAPVYRIITYRLIGWRQDHVTGLGGNCWYRLSCVTCHEDDNLTSLMTSNERQRQRRHDDRIPWHVTMSDCCRIWRSVVGGSQNCHNTRLISLCPWIESLLIGNLATVIMMLPYL